MGYDPYCKHCQGCGEGGCCSPTMCQNKKDGMYCESYFDELKENTVMLDTLLFFIKEKHNDVYMEFFNKYDDIVEDEKTELRRRYIRMYNTNEEGDDYAR